MNTKVARVTIILIAMIWVLCFYSMGFNGFSIFFVVIGMLMVGAGTQGWDKAKFDESKRK